MSRFNNPSVGQLVLKIFALRIKNVDFTEDGVKIKKIVIANDFYITNLYCKHESVMADNYPVVEANLCFAGGKIRMINQLKKNTLRLPVKKLNVEFRKAAMAMLKKNMRFSYPRMFDR
jgi:hypothetical protein